VVIDTSVLVSAIISPKGPNAQLISRVVQRSLRAYATHAVIEEYEGVFLYDHLRYLDRRKVARTLRDLKQVLVIVKSGGRLQISDHDSDNRIYECAFAAKAHYIVTENTKDFPQGHKYTKIVTARQLLRLLSN
jgi:putative PIN family toxin of toxin-antitoxin system